MLCCWKQELDEPLSTLREAAEFLRDLRSFVMASKFQAAETSIQRVSELSHAAQDLVLAEVHACTSLLLDWNATQQLTSALSTGGIIVALGAIDVSGVSVKELQAALAIGDKRLSELRQRDADIAGSTVAALVTVSKMIVSCRNCSKHSDWVGAGVHAKVCVLLYCIGSCDS